MDQNTGCVITCRKVTEIPVTDVVIKAMEAMAHNQGFKNLKFKNRHGVIFHDADWLAGVDYEDEDEDEALRITQSSPGILSFSGHFGLICPVLPQQ